MARKFPGGRKIPTLKTHGLFFSCLVSIPKTCTGSHRDSSQMLPLTLMCGHMRRSWHGAWYIVPPPILMHFFSPLFFRVCSDAGLHLEVFTPTGPQQWIGNLYSCKSMWFMRYLRVLSLTVGMLTLGAHKVRCLSSRTGAPG